MKPSEAVTTAREQGFCKLSQHVFLWKTDAANKEIDFGEIETEFFLTTPPAGFRGPIPIYGANDIALARVCKQVTK